MMTFEEAKEQVKENSWVLKDLEEELGKLQYGSKEYNEWKEIVKEAVKENDFIFAFAENFRKDREFIKELVKERPLVTFFMDDELKEDKQFVKELKEINPKVRQILVETPSQNLEVETNISEIKKPKKEKEITFG